MKSFLNKTFNVNGMDISIKAEMTDDKHHKTSNDQIVCAYEKLTNEKIKFNSQLVAFVHAGMIIPQNCIYNFCESNPDFEGDVLTFENAQPKKTKKLLFITGGVVSSIGKGLTSASIGALLEARGLKVQHQKFDPYLNVDPGTMNPCQHGEVYVLRDGSETDLDFGHYERFTHSYLTKKNAITSGKIYTSILEKERRGDFLGETVQIVPHLINEIKDRMTAPDADVIINEIGGSAGDIEGQPFFEAIRQLQNETTDSVLVLHMTLLVYLKAAQELKTKPSQHSVAKMREVGILPDFLICRSEIEIQQENLQKLSLFCDVKPDCVIPVMDVDSVYEVPLMLYKYHLDTKILEKLKLPLRPAKIEPWMNLVDNIKSATQMVRIAMIGKYFENNDSYKSVVEALKHASFARKLRIELVQINGDSLSNGEVKLSEQNIDGILIPGGFGERGVDGMIEAIRYARENKVPYFGICLGLQVAVIEFARDVLQLKDANSEEFDEKTTNPVIYLMKDQKHITQKGATMRLGEYDCTITPDSVAYKAYQQQDIVERHRHRYELNQKYEQQMEAKGMCISGRNPGSNLCEIVEIPDHPFFVAVQFHPEFQSKPLHPHPLFRDFIAAAHTAQKKE